MEQFMISIMTNYGYFGVFFLIFIENIFPPIPSEVILTFAGIMTQKAAISYWLVILMATLGSLAGAIVLYYVGYILNIDKIIKLTNTRIGKILRLKEEDVISSCDWFQNKGCIAVFLCRFVPIVRSLISIPAGINKVDMKVFIVYTFWGSAIWNTVLISVGAFAGEYIDYWLRIVNDISGILLAILIMGVVLIIIFRKKKRIKY